MRWSVLLIFCLTCALLLLGCSDKKTASKDYDQAGEDETTEKANVKTGVKPEPDAQVAVIEAENPAYGKIVIELYPNIAPKMVARFKQLIGEGFYNGTTFHRVNPELGIIQGGDPLSTDNDPNNDGTGKSNNPNLEAEFSDVQYDRGIVGAARGERDVNSANSQFYITLKRVPDFDQRYTVFGRVISGLNNADVIAGAPVIIGTERPADKIVIKTITLQPRSSVAAK